MRRKIYYKLMFAKGLALSFFRSKKSKEGYYLFLDDERFPKDVFNYTGDSDYLRADWLIVRSYDRFVDMINKNGLPAKISFDHDLSDEHMKYYFDNGGHANPPDPSKGDFKEKTGMECAKWLVDYCIDNTKPLPEYKVHSKNICGKQNIESYLFNYLKHSKQ